MTFKAFCFQTDKHNLEWGSLIGTEDEGAACLDEDQTISRLVAKKGFNKYSQANCQTLILRSFINNCSQLLTLGLKPQALDKEEALIDQKIFEDLGGPPKDRHCQPKDLVDFIVKKALANASGFESFFGLVTHALGILLKKLFKKAALKYFLSGKCGSECKEVKYTIQKSTSRLDMLEDQDFPNNDIAAVSIYFATTSVEKHELRRKSRTESICKHSIHYYEIIDLKILSFS